MWNPLARPITATSTAVDQPELRHVYVLAIGEDSRASPTALVCDRNGQVTPVPFSDLQLDVQAIATWAGSGELVTAGAQGGTPPDDRGSWAGGTPRS